MTSITIDCQAQQYHLRPKDKADQTPTACKCCREIIEIYAGMEGFVAETAPEGYLQRIIEQMYAAAAGGDNAYHATPCNCSHPGPVCGQPYKHHDYPLSIVDGCCCVNQVDGVMCGHDRACHSEQEIVHG